MSGQSYQDWIKSLDQSEAIKPQETVVEEQTQENPAVSKLREAFDAAKNAIVEGTELAKIVHDLQGKVLDLGNNVLSLQRDLEYTRSRNKELDEQVTEVRRQRDSAYEEVRQERERANTLDSALSQSQELANRQSQRINSLEVQFGNAVRERDDAMVMALEYESKLKTAEATLATIQAVMSPNAGRVIVEPVQEDKPKPHYEVQPRDEVGKFQPFDEAKTYPHGSQGESSF